MALLTGSLSFCKLSIIQSCSCQSKINRGVNLLLSHKCICEKGNSSSRAYHKLPAHSALCLSATRPANLSCMLHQVARRVLQSNRRLSLCARASERVYRTHHLCSSKSAMNLLSCNKRLPSLVILMRSHIKSAQKSHWPDKCKITSLFCGSSNRNAALCSSRSSPALCELFPNHCARRENLSFKSLAPIESWRAKNLWEHPLMKN
jgi:hypothetical protein